MRITSSPFAIRPETPVGALRPSAGELLRLVPDLGIQFGGTGLQANGLDLPVVAINLDHRPDRWAKLRERLLQVGLSSVVRAPAVVGAKLDGALIRALLDDPAADMAVAPRSHLTLTPPAIGCSLSHLAIWRRVVAENVPRVLVLEDDACPTEHFTAERLGRLAGRVQSDCDIAFPGCLIMHGLAEQAGSAEAARLYYFNGTFAYIVTPAICERLTQIMLPLRYHIDHQLSHSLVAHRQSIAARYAAQPLFAPDWSLRSDCFVPLSNETAADRELGRLLQSTRDTLLAEGRPLLAVD